MDSVVKTILDYSRDATASGFDSKSSDEIKKRIADSIITSYGAKDSEPVGIIRKALLPSFGKNNSKIYFTNENAPVDIAAFVNGSMTRYLDYNDTYLSKEALHPSDNIPPMISVSDAIEADGEKTIRSIGVAYQVIGALSDVVSIRDLGWDHVTYISISSAAGLASLLELDGNKFENAISLGLNNNISMRQTRAGELSMWKGCTAANASRNSVFASMLAREGFTGPYPVFEGEMGFFKQVSGKFELNLKGNRILKTMIKNYPVEYHAMSAAEASVNLRERMHGEIERIDVETFTVANTIIIKDPEKLRPRTKETADHSMPFIIAYTLLNGAPGADSYSEKYLKDQKILSTIDKMKFKVTEKFDSMYPDYLPVKISVKTTEGVFEEEIDVPKGHHRNPYSWDDLQKKGNRVMGDENSEILVNFVRSFEKRSSKELLEVISDVNFEG